MKMIKPRSLIAFVTTFILVLLLLTPAFASRGCNTTDGEEVDASTYIDTDNTAAGQKYYGTLALYFDPQGTTGLYTMYIFIRLGTGNDLYSFAGVIPDMPWNGLPGCDQECAVLEEQNALETYFGDVVVPYLYKKANDDEECAPGENGTCPPYQLKSVDNIASDDPETSFLRFNILDFTLAVQY